LSTIRIDGCDVLAETAQAPYPIPKESGFSGYSGVGDGVASVKSNALASAGFRAEVADKEIDSQGKEANSKTV
jgi:hypothetical protein